MGKLATAERVSRDASDNFVYQRSLLQYDRSAEIVSGDVLEIGTGTGYGIELVAPHCDRFVTVDKYAAGGDRHAANVEFRRMCVPPLGFGDESFDFVITFQVIEHIDDDAAARAAFGRVAHRLGIAGGQPSAPSRRARIVAWSQRIAAVLVVPLLCAFWLLYADRKPEAEWLEQQVPYGEMASLTLPDGTQLHLNSGSRITYPSAFTGKERRIFVEGEIFADVAKDPRKPFIIQSGEVGIRVLGTRFNF